MALIGMNIDLEKMIIVIGRSPGKNIDGRAKLVDAQANMPGSDYASV